MELVKSKTKLFRAITKHILQHSHRKHSTSHVSKLKEENYKEILAEIGKVALEGLLKGDLMFEFGQLPEKVRGEQSILVGLLQVSEYGPSLEPMEMVSFIHKSIQEYLAAWYITYRCVPEGNLGGIEQQARTLKDCQALENVFPFICGLSDDGAVKVFQHLTSVRISDPTLDLSKTIPDVENETGVPLCDVTSRHRRFSDLVYDSFREVRSKAELLSHYFNCTGRVVLATSNRPISELVPKVNVLTEQVQNFVFSFQRTGISSLQIQLDKEDLVINKSLEFLNCLQLPLTIPESSKVLTVGDLVRKFQVHHDFNCSFRSFLCCRNGQFQFFITELSLECDYDASLFTESTADSVPSSAASLCSEQSCLKFLSSLHCRKLSGQTVKALGAVIRNCKHLNRIVVEHRDDTVCDLLEQVPNPSITKCTLTIGSFRTYWPGIVNLTSAGAVQLASLLSRYNNIISLRLDLNDCCSTAVDTLITSITHKTLERLVLSKITLTPTAAVALGRLLPEMSSLQELEFTGVDGSVLQTNEIEALFAGFNKTLPLRKLTLSGFSVRGCLTPLIKSFLFFPNLRELTLGGFKREFNMDEQNLCHLLESLRLIPNLKTLSVKGILLSQAHCCTAEVNPVASVTHKTLDKLHLDGISLTPAVATVLGRLLPKMSSLQELELTGVDGSILEAKEMEALFGGFNKTLPLSKLTFSGFSVRGCLAPLTKSFQFIPNLKELTLKMLNLDEDDQCGLLESFRFICNNLNSLVMRVKQHGHTSNLLFHFYYYYHFYYYKLDLDVLSLTPAVAAALGRLLSEMSSLKKLRLTGVDGSILEAKEMEALFGGFNKTLPLSELTFSGFSVRGCLAPLTKSFCFFPNLRWLILGGFNMDEHNLCLLLESLRFIPNLEILMLTDEPVRQEDSLWPYANPTASDTHKNLEILFLERLRLTPAVAAMLGQSLPEMSSLEDLYLTGVDGSILEAKEMEALFGGFNKTLRLRELTFSGFSVRGCLAPLSKSLQFFPNLRELNLEKLNMDENDLCGLLNALCCTAEESLTASVTLEALEKLSLDGISLTSAVVEALGRSLPEMPSLIVLSLTGVDGSALEAKKMEALFGGFNETLPLRKLTFSGVSVRGCLAPLTKSFRFFPNLRELNLGGFNEEFNMDEQNLCLLLESLRFIPNLKTLSVKGRAVSQAHCCTAEVNPITSVAHNVLKQLHLDRISLTPAAAAALGRSLPEMSSLKVLMLSGVDGSILEAKKMEALFGGFNKTLPLRELTFSNFSVRGCLAPLTKSFRFFPNLRELNLGGFSGEFKMGEQSLCLLLESLRFIPNLKTLSVKGKLLREAHCCTAEVNPIASVTHKTLEQLSLDGISLTSAIAAMLGRLLPEMSSLQELELTGVNGSILEAKELEALFGGFNKTLPLRELTFRSFSVRGCLTPLTKSFRFFPYLRELNLGSFHVDEHILSVLLENLKFTPNLKTLSVEGKPLTQVHCCTAEVHPIASVTLKNLKKLSLDGISLTTAVAAMLSQSLPEMSFLEVLKLTGVDESILEAKELEKLFDGFNKTLPLSELSFSGFSVRGCLAPFTKSFRFFPNLRELQLGGSSREFSVDEQNLFVLLESLRFIPYLKRLIVKVKLVSQANCCATEVNPIASVALKTLEHLSLDGISLTPAVAAVLGRLLPEMSSLEVLKLTGVDGRIFEAKEMEALFGGLNKTLPLSELTFSAFSVRGCLAPLSKSLQFFPNLRELNLEKLNMDGNDLCGLLNVLCCTAKANQIASVTHKTLEQLRLDGISLTPAAAAALGRSLPDMSSLEVLKLTGVDGSILEAKEMEVLFGGFNKTLPLSELTFSGFSVRGCLSPLTKSLQFFPNLRELNLKKLDIDEHDLCGLLNAHCCRAEESLTASVTLKTLKTLEQLSLDGISLTPAAATALGQSLPEMSFLEVLKLTGVDGSILEAKEMEVLFGGFNKTLPLGKLTFSGFSVRGCLAPLTKSFRFFPDLTELQLEKLNMDEDDQCSLLESLKFIPDLTGLKLQGCSLLGDSGCYTAEVNKDGSFVLNPHKRLELYGIILTPAVATALGRSLPQMSSLQEFVLTGVEGSILKTDEMEALFGGFIKPLPLYKLTIKGFNMTSCLAPLTKSFRFFPNLRKLKLEELYMDELDQCCFLESLRLISNLEILSVKGKPLSYADNCTAEVNKVGGFTLNSLKELKLNGIILTPAVAAALGWLLPEMLSLQELELTGMDESILQAGEMEALFGGFKKTLSLNKLSFRGFNVKSCLAPLTKSLQFFPSLTKLDLANLNMDEHDLCGLLESFRFIRKLEMLSLPYNPLGHVVRSIVPHITNLPWLWFLDIDGTSSEEDLEYVRETVEQDRLEQERPPPVFFIRKEFFSLIELELMKRLLDF
ncbi:uncharacterized protein LOC144650891 isoform X3 [Oculina patagonica]